MENIDLENLDDEMLIEMLGMLEDINDELGGNDNE